MDRIRDLMLYILTCASNLIKISRRLRSRPVILTFRYGSRRSNVAPLESTASFGEMNPGSDCP